MVNGERLRPGPVSMMVAPAMAPALSPSPRPWWSTTTTTRAGSSVPASARRISAALSYSIRALPTESFAVGCWLCGNHFNQSQWARLRSAITPTMNN